MPSVIETIHSRYAVRRFAATPVPDDVLLAILDAGRRSQSSKNTQPQGYFVLKIVDTNPWPLNM